MSIVVAQIGYGRMGLIHMRNAHQNSRIQLKYIIGTNKEKLDEITKEFAGVKPTTDFDEVLKDSEVKGIIVCSPSSKHADHIIQALKAGKAVFSEKPVALNESDIKRCYATAAECNLPLLCGYQRRFDSDFRKIKELIETRIGKVQLLRLTSRDHPPPPKEYLEAPSSGSFFDDFATHDVDVARWLTGEEPELIYGTASSFLGNKNSDDTSVIVLKFPSGALCLIDNSRQTTYGYDIRLEAIGPNGMASLNNPPISNVVYSAQHGNTTDCAHYSFPQRFEAAYKAELEHWINVLEGKENLKILENDCIQASRITTACQSVRDLQLSLDSPSKLKDDLIYPTINPGEEIGVIIFGAGRMGRVRAKVLESISNVKVLYCFDIIESSVKSFMSEFSCDGFVLNDDSIKKALSDSRVKCVFISTTSSSHYELITASLNNGKHVFCEKPLALTTQHIIDCVNLAKEKSLSIYCGFHRRNDKHFQQLARKLEGKTKQLIRITSRESSSNSSLAYLLSSGGFLFDSVIHDFDMACYFSNEYPIEVFCQGTAFNEQLKQVGDVDSIVIVLRFPSGTIASIDNHRNAVYGYDQRVEVHTDVGLFSTENLSFTTVKVGDSNGFTTDNPANFLERYGEAYQNETCHYISLLKGEEKQSKSIPSDYIVTAKIAEGAAESLKTGKPVKLQF